MIEWDIMEIQWYMGYHEKFVALTQRNGFDLSM